MFFWTDGRTVRQTVRHPLWERRARIKKKSKPVSVKKTQKIVHYDFPISCQYSKDFPAWLGKTTRRKFQIEFLDATTQLRIFIRGPVRPSVGTVVLPRFLRAEIKTNNIKKQKQKQTNKQTNKQKNPEEVVVIFCHLKTRSLKIADLFRSFSFHSGAHSSGSQTAKFASGRRRNFA